MDTAGIRAVEDVAEKEGVRRSLQSIENADLVLAIFDASEPLAEEDFDVMQKVKGRNTVFVLNKSDLPSAVDENSFPSSVLQPSSFLRRISATRGDGLEELKETIFNTCLRDWKEEREGVVVTNLRHKTAIEHSLQSLNRAVKALTDDQPVEIVALELRDSLDRIGEIVGTVTTEDILNKIFSDFCIGK